MLYQLALFLHITGALGLSAAYAVEWFVLSNIESSNKIGTLKESVSNYFNLSIIGGISMGLILIPGIYMMTEWKQAGWIIAGFVGLILIGALGGILTGRRMRTARSILKVENSSVTEVKHKLDRKILLFSYILRVCLFLGIVFIMVFKPAVSSAFIALGIAGILGIILGKIKTAWKQVEGMQLTQKID